MFARPCAAALALALLAAPAPQAPGKGLPPVPGKTLPAASGPNRLAMFIGGLTPPGYSLTLDGEEIRYATRSVDPKVGQLVETTRTIRPSPEQWREFWGAMDEVGLWDWKPVYEDKTIFDGTAWSVEAAHDGKSVRSRGRVLTPGQETAAEALNTSDPGGYGPKFGKYLAAVEKLLGGQPFR